MTILRWDEVRAFLTISDCIYQLLLCKHDVLWNNDVLELVTDELMLFFFLEEVVFGI